MNIFSGKSPKYSKIETPHKIIGQQVNQDYGLDFKYLKYGTDEFVENMAEMYYLQNYDVLLNTLGGGTVGRSGIYISNNDEKILTDGHLFVFRLLDNLTANFLLFYLKLKRTEIERNANGSTNQTFLNLGKTIEWLFPLPPLSEQKRIVSKIEELEPFVEEYGKAETELTALNTNFPEQIKKSILQYAIQGKLVEQDPNDEPASVLLEKIKAEKAELVKQGKIKKDKQESYIYKGTDNRHYEKIGSEIKDITDEIPFEIPNSWSWIRLSSIGITQTGTTPSTSHSEYFGKDIPFIKPADISNNSLEYNNEGLSFEGIRHTRLISAQSVLMVCIGGSIGKCYVNDRDVCCNQQINTFTPIISHFLYFLYLMQSDYFYKTTILNATGTATPIINKTDWGNIIIPLPPLSEQKRIVEKLENVFQFIKTL